MSPPLKFLTGWLKPAIGTKPIVSILSDATHCCYSTSEGVTEDAIKELLQLRFQTAAEIAVQDVSGGCGAMFNVYVASAEFKGLSIVKQHKAITDTLKEQIKKIHGLRIETKAL